MQKAAPCEGGYVGGAQSRWQDKLCSSCLVYPLADSLNEETGRFPAWFGP
jgi:hypothetical protein